MTGPRFRHPCPSCHFLGQSSDGLADLYACGQPIYLLVARHADHGEFDGNPHDDIDGLSCDALNVRDCAPGRIRGYGSSPLSFRQVRLAEAYMLAKKTGLLTY